VIRLDFSHDLNLVRSQKLLLTPQLKQAIEILEMDSRELFRSVENQLDTNPALEEAFDEEVPDGEYIHEAHGSADAGQYAPMSDHFIEQPEKVLTLKQHLLVQLDALCLDKNSYAIGEFLIDNTDDNGYLKADTAEAAAFLDVSESKVLEVLKKLQSLYPPGICARNLCECLLIQLRQLEEPDAEAELVVERFLDAVAKNDAETVAKATGISIGRVHEVFRKIRSLEPRPGRNYCSSELMSDAMPDVIIIDNKEDLQVIYNDEAFPNICISESFAAGLYRKDGGRAEQMREWLNRAAWLIKCLEQREDIIFAVAQKICDFRSEFFKKGPKALKPIDKRTFASHLYLHESILDKALAGKYLQCKWGLYELRSFFKEA